MAWTDQCKIEAVKQVDHKIDQLGVKVRDALKAVSQESDIPAGTLKRWKYPNDINYVPQNGNRPQTIEALENKLKSKAFDLKFYILSSYRSNEEMIKQPLKPTISFFIESFVMAFGSELKKEDEG